MELQKRVGVVPKLERMGAIDHQCAAGIPKDVEIKKGLSNLQIAYSVLDRGTINIENPHGGRGKWTLHKRHRNLSRLDRGVQSTSHSREND